LIQRSLQVDGKPDIAGTPDEVDMMISTDVLSEGQNLQDCGIVVNYDLHWNPTRMVQRAAALTASARPLTRSTFTTCFPTRDWSACWVGRKPEPQDRLH